ncbi:carbohydrate kinase family protein [Candidatus Peregrinibacteria bacterium]|nr:carbohydrate kinase family protein [Candidatus Peregrinibacteria bacterium]
MKNLLVTGSIAIDRISVFHDRFANHILPEKVHKLNVAFTVEKMTINYGGTGGNIAYSLALMGEKPILLGSIGDDARDYIKHLKKHKIDCDYLYKSKTKLTAHATIMTDMDDNQITSFYMGAMSEASKTKISHIAQLTSQSDLAIIAPNDIGAMLQYADECRKNGIKFIADPGQAIPGFSAKDMKAFIKNAYILICNDYEWDMIQEKTGFGLPEALSNVDYLIITYGESGSKIWKSGGATVVDVPIVKTKNVVDPTGCGDAYRSGLMYGIVNGYSIEQSANIGAWIASKAVSRAGTQNHRIVKTDFQKFLKKI